MERMNAGAAAATIGAPALCTVTVLGGIATSPTALCIDNCVGTTVLAPQLTGTGALTSLEFARRFSGMPKLAALLRICAPGDISGP